MGHRTRKEPSGLTQREKAGASGSLLNPKSSRRFSDVAVAKQGTRDDSVSEKTRQVGRREKITTVCAVCLCAVSGFVATANNYLLCGVALSVLGTVGSHLLGNFFFPRYDLYMPFCGGTEFMLLQAQGYTIVGLANVAALCIYWGNYETTDLFLAALGVAQVIAMSSTTQALFFYNGRPVNCHQLQDILRLARQRKSKHRMWFRNRIPLIFVVIALGVALYSSGYFITGAILSILSTTYCILHPLIHDVRGWKLWQPMEGGEAFVLLQAQGWLILGLLLNVVFAIVQFDAADAPGTGLGCSILHGISVSCLVASVNRFDAKQQMDEKEAKKYVGTVRLRVRTFYFLLVLLGIVTLSSIPYLFCRFSLACSSNQLMMPLLAAPMAQTSGWYFVPTYKGFKLSGGFRSMLCQTNGWLLYLIAIVSSQAHDSLFLHVMGPVGACGATCIALSVYFHEDVESERKEGQPLVWYATFGALLLLFIAWWDLTVVQLAILGLSVHFAAVFVGVHMMWTHFWLVASMLAYVIDNELLLATMLVTGLALTVPWYLIALLDFKSFIGFRSLAGWSLFFGERYQELLAPFVGKKEFRGPFHHLNTALDRLVLYGSFWCVDIVMHLIPCLLLLRYLHLLSILSVILAFLMGQFWRRVVSFHHLSPDWDLLRSSYRVKWKRRKHSDNYTLGGVDIAAFSAIYGFTNSDFPCHPQEMLNLLQQIEYSIFLAAIACCMCVPVEVLTFFAELSSVVASTLIKLSIVSASIGNIGLAVSCVRGWMSVPH